MCGGGKGGDGHLHMKYPVVAMQQLVVACNIVLLHSNSSCFIGCLEKKRCDAVIAITCCCIFCVAITCCCMQFLGVACTLLFVFQDPSRPPLPFQPQ